MAEAFVIAVVGATATGKSDLADRLALRYRSAVISADSMQVYRGMDIGTAKLDEHSRLSPHFGIDIVEPDQAYSAAQFQEYARPLIERYLSREVCPIVCGGTGLYVRAALDDLHFPAGDQVGNVVRAKWTQYADELGDEALYRELKQRDPDSASVLHAHNRKRVIRALEMYEQGESYFEQASHFADRTPYYPTCYIGLDIERSELYRRINARVDDMLAHGLVEEARTLYAHGLRDTYTARSAIGYKELFSHFEAETTLEEAINRIKRHSRRYAKRQCTWFRSDPRVQWIPADGLDQEAVMERAIDIIEAYTAKENDETVV